MIWRASFGRGPSRRPLIGAWVMEALLVGTNCPLVAKGDSGGGAWAVLRRWRAVGLSLSPAWCPLGMIVGASIESTLGVWDRRSGPSDHAALLRAICSRIVLSLFMNVLLREWGWNGTCVQQRENA